MWSSYRTVLGRPGSARLTASGLVARLPIAMVALGLVLLVADATGSYATAGSVSAAFTLAHAATALLHGRLLDRLGQSRVLVPFTVAHLLALAGTVVLVRTGQPPVPVHLAAAVSGACFTQVGSSIRARWSFVLDRPGEVQTAYAWESVVDEVVFMVGPVLVTVLATTLDPVAGLVAAGVTGLAGTLALVGQRSTEPPAHPRPPPGGERPAMPWRTVVPAAAVSLGLGAMFGSIEVATVAVTDEQGAQGWSGPLLAVYAGGSLVAGLLTGAVRWRVGAAARTRRGALLLAVLLAPLPLVPGLLALGPLLFLAGCGIAPTLLATLALVEQRAPRSRLTEGMALLHTGIAGGVAPGAAVAGAVVDATSGRDAYVVPLLAAVLAAVAALGVPRSAAGED